MSMNKRVIQQMLNKQPDRDKERQHIELYCFENRDSRTAVMNNFIFNGEQLFLTGYPYSIELTAADFITTNNPQDFQFNECRFFEAHEGTLIRVFNIDDKWYTSTNRRLDAFNSKWAAKTTTFGLHFANAVQENIRALNDDEFFEEDDDSLEEKKKRCRNYLNETYEANLDKSKKYMFLLEPCKEERIVCTTSSPRFFNIGVFDKENNISLDEDVTMGFPVPKPKEIFFNDVKDMLDALSGVDHLRIQGFIAIQRSKDHQDKHFKILNDQYKYYSDLRGNTSSISFRFLELDYQNTIINLKHGTNHQTTSQTQKMLADFCRMYQFDSRPLLEYIWTTIAKDLYNKYYNRYITKGHADPSITQKQDMILKQIHNHYVESVKDNHRQNTTRTRINDILSMQKPSVLNQLIGEYKKNDKDAERKRSMM